MQKIKQFLSGKKSRGLLLIVLIALAIEIFICNFSFWKTLGCESVLISSGGVTNESGQFNSETISIDDPVKNVSVRLVSITGTDRATALVCLTDEGNSYEYPTPEYTIVPGVKKSEYMNIYPYGEVNEIRVVVNVPEGCSAEIGEIYANAKAPFMIYPVRLLVILGVALLFYGVFTASFIHEKYCERKNKIQWVLIGAAILFFWILGYKMVTSNPKCVESPWPHHAQYQELAHSLEKGTVALEKEPSAGLLEKENPYDTSALFAENIEFHMDYAFFDGQYYVYFGPVPEFLLYYPYYLMTGNDLANYKAFYCFYLLFVVGAFTLVWEMVHRFAKKFPFYLYLLLGAAICLFPNYVFMAGRPDLYNIPIMAGTAFTLFGISMWMKGLAAVKQKVIFYAIGSLCMALVAGCRPQLLLYSAVAIPLFYKDVVKERNFFSKKSWKETLGFVLPYVLMGCFVFWYNAARFGSGFDFGATYSLTSNDMNTRGFNFSRLMHGLFSYLFQPPVIDSAFPFLHSSNLDVNYMGRNITEFMFGGIFAVNPLLWIIPFTVFVKGMKKVDVQAKWMSIVLFVAGFIIVCFDINGAGNLQRYASDMVPGFLLATLVLWIVTLDRVSENGNYHKWAKIITLCLICGFAFAFLTFVAKGDSVGLLKNNAELFYNIESYFKF